MNHYQVKALRERIAAIIEQANAVKEPEAKSDLACLTCIFLSALIEASCRLYVSKYAGKRSDDTVLSYVKTQLYYFQNGKVEDIAKVLKSFSVDLSEKFVIEIGDEGKDAIDSVVNVKNQLVHAKGVGIGLDTTMRYHKNVIKSLDILRDMLSN